MKNFKYLKAWQKWSIIFFVIHSILVIANFIWATSLAMVENDGSWVVVAIFVNFIDKPVVPLLVISERIFPYSKFGDLKDWFVHPICFIFGGLFYAFLGSILGLIIGRFSKQKAA